MRRLCLITKLCKAIDVKRYEFPIDSYQSQWMFEAIRSKRDVIALLMRTIKIMMLPPLPTPEPAGHIILQVSKMSRLFFVMENKMFSFNFPFTVIKNNGYLTFRSIHHAEINSMVASQVLALLEATDSIENRDVLHFAEPISDLCQYDGDFWCLFRDLLMHEDGYIRYDHDAARKNGHLHPLHHLDIFYTTGNTFKLGVNSSVSLEHFLDVLDVDTNCHYVTPVAQS